MSEDQIKQIENKVIHHSIYFNRVPSKTWNFFKAYADDNWSSDYGAALTAICSGVMPPDNSVLSERLDLLERRVLELESIQIINTKVEQPSKGVIKLLNGTILNR